ncbi:hypothetical protein ACHAW5_003301 [Stephanodiscus triporus]|uniref:Allantoicase domain-containing protein n=1 Tax=Stephanodiscus triporus TaxID=2934178 RepID=A0ABD3QBZ3_9STRA
MREIADPNNVDGEWIEVIPASPLNPGHEGTRHHSFAISDEASARMESIGGVTHLRLNYYPDGGVARMRAYGRPLRRAVEGGGGRRGTPSTVPGGGGTTTTTTTPGRTIVSHDSSLPLPSARPHPTPELSSELNGGIGLACSDAHYGEPGELLRAGPGTSMKDGWETARHPDRPGVVVTDPTTGLQETTLSDWCVIRLGLGGAAGGTACGIDGSGPGGVDRIVVDTRHFKGNYPESVAIDGCRVVDGADGSSDERVRESAAGGGGEGVGGIEWFPLLKRTPMTAHAEHEYTKEGHYLVNTHRSVTHVRVTITPDGGLSRVRIYGSPAADDAPRGSSKL